MATSTPQDDYMKTALRLPRDLHAKIQAATVESGRSLNGEFVARLTDSFEPRVPASAEELVKELSFVRHMYERQIQALDFGQNLMAECLIVASEALPEELLKNGAFSAAMKMAQGIRKKDGTTLVEAFAELFPELKKSGTTRELQELAGKHARGEDITSDLLRHYKEDRAKWEAKQAQPDEPEKAGQPDKPVGGKAVPGPAAPSKRRMNLGRGKAEK